MRRLGRVVVVVHHHQPKLVRGTEHGRREGVHTRDGGHPRAHHVSQRALGMVVEELHERPPQRTMRKIPVG